MRSSVADPGRRYPYQQYNVRHATRQVHCVSVKIRWWAECGLSTSGCDSGKERGRTCGCTYVWVGTLHAGGPGTSGNLEESFVPTADKLGEGYSIRCIGDPRGWCDRPVYNKASVRRVKPRVKPTLTEMNVSIMGAASARIIFLILAFFGAAAKTQQQRGRFFYAVCFSI